MILSRYYHPTGVLGRLHIPGGLVVWTLERPWMDNQPYISCIPEGLYGLDWDTTGRIRDTPRLAGVPGRTHINIHAANYVRELHGCIALGMDYEYVDREPRLISSRAAMDLFREQYRIPQDDGDAIFWNNGQPAEIRIEGIV